MNDREKLLQAERDDIKVERERVKRALRGAIRGALAGLGYFTWGPDAWIREGEEGEVLDTVEALQREGFACLAAYVQEVRNLWDIRGTQRVLDEARSR